jgi:hypothetical protein
LESLRIARQFVHRGLDFREAGARNAGNVKVPAAVFNVENQRRWALRRQRSFSDAFHPVEHGANRRPLNPARNL